MNKSAIAWQTHDGQPPTDGRIEETCALSPLTDLLNINCSTGIIIIMLIIFSIITIIVTILFIKYKRR